MGCCFRKEENEGGELLFWEVCCLGSLEGTNLAAAYGRKVIPQDRSVMGIWGGVRTHLSSSSRIMTDGIPEGQKTTGEGVGCAQLYHSTVNGKRAFSE